MLRPLACLLLLPVALVGCGDSAQRDTAGNIVSKGAVDIFAMKVGDCFNDKPDEPRDAPATLGQVPGLPCEEPHDYEIYASYRIALDKYPGDEALLNVALKGCLDRFESFVRSRHDDSVLDAVPLYPTRKSWARQKDREVLCALFRRDERQMTGTMRDAQI